MIGQLLSSCGRSEGFEPRTLQCKALRSHLDTIEGRPERFRGGGDFSPINRKKTQSADIQQELLGRIFSTEQETGG